MAKLNKLHLFLNKAAAAAVITLLLAATALTPAAFAQNYGTIDAPPGVPEYQAEANLPSDQPALIFFLSRMITLITVVAGLWVIVNVVVAAFHYISGGGSAEAHVKVRNLLTYSVIGLLLIIVSYTIGGIIGLIFFGDATYILSPTV